MTLDEVQAALNSKELNQRTEEKSSVVAEGLNQRTEEKSSVVAEGFNVRGRTDKHEAKQRFKSRSKSRSKSKVNIKCYHYHKEGHIRRLCLERQKGNQENKREQA